jgi:hypothetical protein
MAIVNVPLLKNPINWIIVTLMLVIAGIAGHYAFTLAGIQPPGSASKS